MTMHDFEMSQPSVHVFRLRGKKFSDKVNGTARLKQNSTQFSHSSEIAIVFSKVVTVNCFHALTFGGVC